MRQFNKQRTWIAVLAFAVLGSHLPTVALGDYHEVEEIKPFGMLDTSGFFRAGYYMDERGYPESSTSASTLQQQLWLSGKGFFYHPGLVNMELGGGPIFLQQRFDDTSGDTRQNDSLFDFLARVNILDLKDYPVSVWYERSHPAVATGLAGRFLTQSDEVGMSGHVGRLFRGSTTLRYSMSQRDDEGSGFGSVVDNSFDVRSFQLLTNYRQGDRLELKYYNSYLDSESGSAGLPIVRSTTDIESGEIRSLNLFGAQKQFRLNQTLFKQVQKISSTNDTRSDSMTYSGNLDWRNFEKLRSNLRYRFGRRERESSTDQDVDTSDAELSIVYQRDADFWFSAAAEYSSEEQDDFNRDESAIRGNVSYMHPTDFGAWSVGGSLRGARVSQEASDDTIAVFDEPHVLRGTTPVDLRNDFVVEGSIVVSNAVQTQIFEEGFDYRVITVGSTTSIQRLLGGNIEDGETVLVDYEYETSGTADYDTLGSTATMNIWFLDTMNAYVRYGIRDSNLRSGRLTNPINDGKSLEYGISTSNQFLDGWSVSAQYSHLDRDEDISPFVRDSVDLNLKSHLLGTWSVYLGLGVAKVDYEASVENVDQTTYRIGISGRPVRGGLLNYDASYLEDVGGTLPRKQTLHRLSFRWTYRQFRLVTSAYYSEEEQGASERDNIRITAQITRLF